MNYKTWSVIIYQCYCVMVIFWQINDYGYGRLTARSESELLWEHMNATTGKATDSLIIEKQV